MKQADLAVELYGPEALTALLDIVVSHPTAASYVNKYGHSGDTSNIAASRKHSKYDPLIARHHLKFQLILGCIVRNCIRKCCFLFVFDVSVLLVGKAMYVWHQNPAAILKYVC
eukprot:COSAG01_NODE_529_length_15890_cov_548.099994_14_plen_113_part_00